MTIHHTAILETRTSDWLGEADCARFARELAAKPSIWSAFIELHGPLGAGKTTLVRYLLQALGVTGRVKSPTYTVLEPYQINGRDIAHFDFYRFNDPQEWLDAGLRDVFAHTGLKLVEWPEKAGSGLPTPDLRLHINPGDLDDSRHVRVEALSPLGLELLN